MIEQESLDKFIIEFFDCMKGMSYICLRKPEFKASYPFDIDLLCSKDTDIVTILKSIAKKHSLKYGFKNNDTNKLHFDIFSGKNLIVRFDINFNLNFYKFLRPKEYFAERALSNAELIVCVYNNKDILLKIPNNIDEAVFRYLEFYNFFPYNEDKIKHLEWVFENLSDQEEKEFYEYLHQISDFKDFLTYSPLEIINYKPARSFANEMMILVEKATSYYKRYGLRRFIQRVLKR